MSVHREEKSSHNTGHNTGHMSDLSKNMSKLRGQGMSHNKAVAKALEMENRDERGRSTRKS